MFSLSYDMSCSPDKPVRVAVVTGGHFYEVVEFHRLFRSLDGIDAYVQPQIKR